MCFFPSHIGRRKENGDLERTYFLNATNSNANMIKLVECAGLRPSNPGTLSL